MFHEIIVFFNGFFVDIPMIDPLVFEGETDVSGPSPTLMDMTYLHNCYSCSDD
jgi:hypothetical protein